MFGKRDIGRVEREFLDVLDWELSLHESDIVAQLNLLLTATRLTQPLAYHHLHHRYHPLAGTATRRSSTFDLDDDSDWSGSSEDESSSSSESDVAPRTPVHGRGPHDPRERRIVSPSVVMYDTKTSQKHPQMRISCPSMPHPSLQLELPDPIDSIAFVPTHVF